jgi:hypothetical protein
MADVVENLNTLAKEVFGDAGVPDLIPNMTKVQQKISFSKKEVMGLKFAQTVRLAYPTGFTHALGDGTAGAFSFQDAIGGTQARAELTGSQILLRDQMAYEDAAKCTGSTQAFKDGTKFFFEGLQSSMRKRLETQLLYGAQGLAITASSTNVDATHTAVTFTAASWNPGTWAGNEGMQVNFYNGATLVSSAADAIFAVQKVDNVNRKVTFTGTATGITALDSGIGSGARTAWYVNAKGNEMTGIHGIVNNTGSLFGIDASANTLWGSTQYAPTSGALTFAKVKKAVALAVGKGLDEDCILLMNPSTWDDVNSDIAGLRMTDKSEVKKVEVGSEEIVYHSQNGKIELIPSIYVKEGFAYGLVPKFWKRIGAADVTFNTPGFGGEMFIHLQTKAGVESRAYTHQAVICMAPAKQFLISSIVNTAL